MNTTRTSYITQDVWRVKKQKGVFKEVNDCTK